MTSCKNLPIPLLYNIKMFFFPLSFITSSSFKCYNNNLQNGFLFPPWVTKEFTIKETFYIFNGITKIFNEECFFLLFVYCLFVLSIIFVFFIFFFLVFTVYFTWLTSPLSSQPLLYKLFCS